MNYDIKWMELAIKEAEKAESIGEVPVGAILIKNNEIISSSHNQIITQNDPTAHAEIIAIRNAGKKIENYRIVDSTLYVTLEPCAMCFSAIIHARIKRLVFGAFDKKTGVCGSCVNLVNANFYNHKIEVYGGILEETCSHLLRNFFISRR